MRKINVALVDERVADKKVLLVDERCADALISVVDERCADMKVAIVSSPFYVDMKVAMAGDVGNEKSDFYTLYTKAQNGNADAQYKLALCYDEGKGVRKDSYEAFKWFKEAALRNHAMAQRAVGICYQYGDGVSKNWDEALRWYRLSISNGSDKAMVSLAGLYLDKYGLNGKRQAKELLERAANRGNQEAKKLLVEYRNFW